MLGLCRVWLYDMWSGSNMQLVIYSYCRRRRLSANTMSAVDRKSFGHRRQRLPSSTHCPVRPPGRRPICCHLAIWAYYYSAILGRARFADRRRCQNDHCAVIWIVPGGGSDGTQLSSRSFDSRLARQPWSNFFIGHLTSVCWRPQQTKLASLSSDLVALVSSATEITTSPRLSSCEYHAAKPLSPSSAGYIPGMYQLSKGVRKYQNLELSIRSVIVHVNGALFRAAINYTPYFCVLIALFVTWSVNDLDTRVVDQSIDVMCSLRKKTHNLDKQINDNRFISQ